MLKEGLLWNARALNFEMLMAQKRQIGAFWMEIAEYGVKNDTGEHRCSWYHISIAVGGDQEHKVFWQEDLIIEDGLESILLTLPLLRAVFSRQFSVYHQNISINTHCGSLTLVII